VEALHHGTPRGYSFLVDLRSIFPSLVARATALWRLARAAGVFNRGLTASVRRATTLIKQRPRMANQNGPSVFAIVRLITRTVALLGGLVAGLRVLSDSYASLSRSWRQKRRRESGSRKEGVNDERHSSENGPSRELDSGATNGDAV
jgi:hypothetical protein